MNTNAPKDDGACDHLTGMTMPPISLVSTHDTVVDIGDLQGISVLYLFPHMTGTPDTLTDDWNTIPGAVGCTPQSCSYRDHLAELHEIGVAHVFGISTQDTAEQKDASTRLHLPYAILSDKDHKLSQALQLPTMDIARHTLLKRTTLILQNNIIRKVFYPVYPPNMDVHNVIEWIRKQA